MDAIGLLGEAQSTASKIPYENIAAGQKSIGLALNAFQAAADTNLKKQQLEKQMAAMQADMFYKNQQHEMDMEKFGWNQKMDIANLNRQYASQTAEQVYRDKMLGFRAQEVNNKVNKGVELLDRGTQYSDKVAALRNEEVPGTVSYGTKYQGIRTEFQDFLQTPQGQRLDNDNYGFHKDAAMQMGKDAQQAHQRFQDNLATIGKSDEFNLDDFTIGKWGDSQDGKGKWIARDPKTGARFSPEEVKARGGVPNDWFHTIPNEYYKIQKDVVADIDRYRSGNPSHKPDIISSNRPLDADTARQFLNQAGGDKAKARELATDAGYGL